MDKWHSLRTGNPPSLHDCDCDLTVPSASSLDGHAYFLAVIQLSMIKSRIYRELYSSGSLQKSDPEVIHMVRELDNELEQWRISITTEYRPAMSFSQDAPPVSSLDMRAVMLQVGYHYCLSVIHHASSRCKAWAGNSDHMMDGLSSSLVVSVDACRSCMYFLRHAQPFLQKEFFWYVQISSSLIPPDGNADRNGLQVLPLLPTVGLFMYILQHTPESDRGPEPGRCRAHGQGPGGYPEISRGLLFAARFLPYQTNRGVLDGTESACEMCCAKRGMR